MPADPRYRVTGQAHEWCLQVWYYGDVVCKRFGLEENRYFEWAYWLSLRFEAALLRFIYPGRTMSIGERGCWMEGDDIR